MNRGLVALMSRFTTSKNPRLRSSVPTNTIVGSDAGAVHVHFSSLLRVPCVCDSEEARVGKVVEV